MKISSQSTVTLTKIPDESDNKTKDSASLSKDSVAKSSADTGRELPEKHSADADTGHDSDNHMSFFNSNSSVNAVDLHGSNIGYNTAANDGDNPRDFVTITGDDNYVQTNEGRDKVTNNGSNVIETGDQWDIIYSGENASGSVYNGGADSDEVVFEMDYDDSITIEPLEGGSDTSFLLTIPTGINAGTYTLIDIERLNFSGDDWSGKDGTSLIYSAESGEWELFDE